MSKKLKLEIFGSFAWKMAEDEVISKKATD